MQTGSLFTGAGGLDMALDAELSWVCDDFPAARRLLDYHYRLQNLGDVRLVDWQEIPPVDILTAGVPCQPISLAGKGLGDKDPRWLWPELYRAVRVLRPRHVFMENPAIILERGLRGILGTFSEMGYDVRWACVRASDAGACHPRQRFFALASHPDSTRREIQVAEAQTGGIPDPAVPARGGYDSWGDRAPAIRRWEVITGRDAPPALIPMERKSRDPVNPKTMHLNPVFSEWLMGLPHGWVTGVPGINYHDTFTLIGNAAVPRQAALALQILKGKPMPQMSVAWCKTCRADVATRDGRFIEHDVGMTRIPCANSGKKAK